MRINSFVAPALVNLGEWATYHIQNILRIQSSYLHRLSSKSRAILRLFEIALVRAFPSGCSRHHKRGSQRHVSG
jgi:hypothetical protein